MLTGDHPETASAIAKAVGIIPDNLAERAPEIAKTMVMTASQFDKLTDQEIDNLQSLPLVIARCAPNTKVRMIDALHRRNAYAAMTGDGVNDSPSLKKADVGIAMGLNGSDVAKDASEIVLTDDNFASIVNAIKEGRRMFDNICKFVLHLLCSNVGEVILLIIGLAFRDNDDVSVFPLAPLQILWINMITSSFPAMGLGMEKALPDVMSRKPHNTKKVSKLENCFLTVGYLYQLLAHRHGCVRNINGRIMPCGLHDRRVWSWNWRSRRQLQRRLFGNMRHRFSCSRNCVRPPHLDLTSLCLGM
jgi:potassium/sodium efflux P-type ATPase